MDKLNLEEASDDYSMKIKQIFHILKNSFDKKDEEETLKVWTMIIYLYKRQSLLNFIFWKLKIKN